MWLPVLSMLVLLSPVQAVADLADLPWQLQLREDGIEVYTAVLPDSRIRAFRGVARIDAPLADVAALIADTARMPDWFPDTEHAATIMDASGTEYAYTVTDAPWPVADRDVVLHASSSFDAATHSMRIDLRAVPDAYPEQPRRVRVREASGYWLLRALDADSTEVEFSMHLDPGGGVPKWLVNSRIVQTPHKALANMRAKLAR